MASEVGRRVAEVILNDRAGPSLWAHPEQLALYLLGSYAPGTLLLEPARGVAEAILADLAGGGRLRDVDALAAFVDGAMAKVREQA